jgi:hypothetical protein
VGRAACSPAVSATRVGASAAAVPRSARSAYSP